MIYQSSHQAPTMSSSRKTSPRPEHKNLQKPGSTTKSSTSKGKRGTCRTIGIERCRGRCRVQWSEQHVKEGLVLVQEAQLARVVKTGPIAEHYEIDPEPFASGQWAKVFKCRSRSTGTMYAAKYSSRNRFNADCSAELRHEIALLSLCSQSPRVVRLHDVYETPKEIILIMEYAPGGDLQTLIDGDLVPLEGDVVHFVRQLVEGLAYLHERNIAHLDIKPQNLVMMGSFPECDVKLCDFEISRVVLEGTEVREILGTPDYVAPEILHYEPITLAADMWSLGVTTYVLLTGFSPFGGESDQETFQNISLGEVDFPEELFEDISAQAKDFVAKLLVLDPSARMSAKQCLRHDWLRGAPTQASPHLRRYLSKSREVLLERVVSRENLRRAALLSQASSNANLSEPDPSQGLNCNLSQSEMCLSYRLTGSRGSLPGSEGYMSPADSRTSLNSSRTSLAMSQSCLLNKEQTQGLLTQAQSKSQANLNLGVNRGLLSRMRSLNHIQSQACLLNGNKGSGKEILSPLFGRSREKLYGLKSLSKSQGVLDIYRSLECLKQRKKNQRAQTEDMLPIFKRLSAEIDASDASLVSFCDADNNNKRSLVSENKIQANSGSKDLRLKNSNDIPLEKQPLPHQIKISEKELPGLVEVVVDERREHLKMHEAATAAAAAAAAEGGILIFDKKKKVVVDERLMQGGMIRERRNSDSQSEYRMHDVPKCSTSGSEENLDSLQSIESDTLTEDSDETTPDRRSSIVKQLCHRQHSDVSNHSNNSVNSEDKDEHSESENEEPKYSVAQLVSAFNKHQEVASKTSLEAIMSEKRINQVNFPTGPKALRLFIPDINITESSIVRRKTSYKPRKNWEELRKQSEKNEGILKDFDNDSGNEDDEEEIDVSESSQSQMKSNNSRDQDFQQGSSTFENNQVKLTIDDSSLIQKQPVRNDLDTRIDEKYKQCVDGVKTPKIEKTDRIEKLKKLVKSEKMKKLSESPKTTTCSKINNSVSYEKERLANYIFPELQNSSSSRFKKDEENKFSKPPSMRKTSDNNSVNLKDILQKVDSFQTTPKENLENLRKRTCIAKILVNDNLVLDNDTNNNGNNGSPGNRLKIDPPSSQEEDGSNLLDVPPSFARSTSLSSESSCPTSSSVQSDIRMSWENIETNRGFNISLEKEDAKFQKKSQSLWTDIQKADINKQIVDGKSRSSTNLGDRKIWGKICTGSYTRAMEKFNGKGTEVNKKSGLVLGASQDKLEKTRRKSTPIMPQIVDS